ncbi:hypothetical protein N7533_001328 [Penicillium manginii]|uniref:uncharacterized protein n=1 Tax=Penicillium manginii TaxID=203109 RepID=UPI00254892FF|nr:uncharacterized protein N7533_001328 [Penicillium manginii]KAJ5762647.1 hypothetical protein N7533_001328 [Penicillium manginii]
MLRHASDGSDCSAASLEDQSDNHRKGLSSAIANKERVSQSQSTGKLACDICRERKLREASPRVNKARSVVTGVTRNVVVARGLATTAATRDERDTVQFKRICHANYRNSRID